MHFRVKIGVRFKITPKIGFKTMNCIDYIQIKIKMPNPSQEPTACFKAHSEDLKDIYVLCILKIKIESQNFEHGYIKDQ